MTDITRIIQAVAAGEASATDDLMPVIYSDLKRLATSKLANEASGHTLQPTALVHEAYMRLVGSSSDSWQNRAHFFGAAAEAMRRILIDHARRKKRIKRGGNAKRVYLSDITDIQPNESEQLLALDEALSELELLDKKKAELVKLKFFGGMKLSEAAKILDIPSRTADRYWAYARAWLQRHVSEQDDE
jgi:RNA polymerase sigma factor (TIGR02999 family)